MWFEKRAGIQDQYHITFWNGWVGHCKRFKCETIKKVFQLQILEIRSTLGCMHWVLSCYIYVYYLLSTKSGKGTFSRIGSVKFTSKLQTENLSTSYLIHAGALFTSREGCVRLSVLCVVSRSSLMDLHLTFKQDLDRKRSGVFGNETFGIVMTLLAVPGGLKL